MSKKRFRHGDVIITEIETLGHSDKLFPRKKDPHILAYGEVTGHSHKLEIDDPEQAFITPDGYLVVNKPTRLVHEEHKHITIPKGIYKIKIQQEVSIDGDILAIQD